MECTLTGSDALVHRWRGVPGLPVRVVQALGSVKLVELLRLGSAVVAVAVATLPVVYMTLRVDADMNRLARCVYLWINTGPKLQCCFLCTSTDGGTMGVN